MFLYFGKHGYFLFFLRLTQNGVQSEALMATKFRYATLWTPFLSYFSKFHPQITQIKNNLKNLYLAHVILSVAKNPCNFGLLVL